jgi:hypothetical protein
MTVIQHDKHFSLDEARALLPWIKGKLDAIKKLFGKLEAKGFDPLTRKWTPKGNGHSEGPPPSEYECLMRVIAEVDMKGVLIRNFIKGIVDFPHITVQGKEVCLCWIVGEETVSHWHNLTERFMDRVPIIIKKL